MKYNVGDKVRVRNDLVKNERYYMEDRTKHDTFIYPMMEFRGQVVTIRNIENGKYGIYEDSYFWTDEMFEGLAEETPKTFHVGDRVKIRQWDDMRTEKIKFGFPSGMKHLCGRTSTITGIDSDGEIHLDFDDKSGDIIFLYSTDMIEPIAKEFHIYDTVKHEKYGIGTVIEVDKDDPYLLKIDFDEWHGELMDNHICFCVPELLTLVQAYTGGEAD